MPATATNSILTHAIITNANSAVSTYATTARSLFQELEGIINNLTSTNFTGAASDGYKSFFQTKVTPALVDNLTESNSLTASITSMLNSIQEQLLDTVDEQLGDSNTNPGGTV